MNEMIFRFEEPWFRPFMTHPKEDSVILQSYYNHPFAKNLNCFESGTRIYAHRIPRFNIPHDVELNTQNKIEQLRPPFTNANDWFVGTVVNSTDYY